MLTSHLSPDQVQGSIVTADNEGRTPLHVAVVSGMTRMIDDLVSVSGDPRLVSNDGLFILLRPQSVLPSLPFRNRSAM